MADLSKIKLPNNTTYNIKDATARTNITHMENRMHTSGLTSVAGIVSAISEANFGNEYLPFIFPVNDTLAHTLSGYKATGFMIGRKSISTRIDYIVHAGNRQGFAMGSIDLSNNNAVTYTQIRA